MRCKLFDCINNDDGYCCVADYVEIEEDGTCSEMTVKSNEEVEE